MNLSKLFLLLIFSVAAKENLSDVQEKQISGLKNLLSNLEGIYPTCNMILFSEMVDFNTADERCKRFHLGSGGEVDGNLATVNNKDKNTDLKLLLEMAYPTSSGKWADDEWVWVGLRKIKNNDKSAKGEKYDADDWSWADNSAPQDFHKWLKGQPDQKIGKINGVEYLQNQMRINHNGGWDDTFAYKTHPYACDYQGKYILSATLKSWSDAKTACEDAGLILAKVRNSQEVEEMTSAGEYFLGPVDETLRIFDPANWIWLGGNDVDEEGVWKWNDGQSIEWFDNMPWRPPQPDNSARMSGGKTQNYLAISKWGQFDDSFDTHKRERPFACQCPGT